MEQLRKKHAEKIRYTFVGIGNTVLDFVLLFSFVAVGLDKIPANYLSTGISMVISFFANKHYTFKSKSEKTRHQFVLFIVFTMIGMWVIQPIVIWSVHELSFNLENAALELFIAKVLATGASFVWNYLMYSRFVFKKSKEVL